MSVKQTLAKVLRKAGLIYLSDFVRYTLIGLQNSDKNKAFLIEHPGVAFPEPYMIYETFRLDYRRYYEKGLTSAQWINDEVSAFKSLSNCHILDWGCGPGRVIRHMPAVVSNNCSFYGTDYNEAYVQWCSANLPGIIFRKNELDPPLKFEGESIDLVYGISIFTHLSETKHEEWMSELLRVVKKGGILFLTTHGDITRENLTPDELKIYNAGNLVTRGHVKEGHRMYTAYQPMPYMHRLFNGRLKVLKHQPGKRADWGLEQDFWILEKL